MPKLPKLHLKTAKQIAVRLTGVPQAHPTCGYRQWVGSVETADPIVALVIIVSGDEVSWTRSTHHASTSLETRILFSPFDTDGREVQVSFGISDAIAYGRTILQSALIHPAPEVGEYVTGHVVDIARIQGKPICELKALFMLRSDVKSVRKGVWHARVEHVLSVDEPWRSILTYGRTGKVNLA
jgi:hypothetical protein